MKIGNMFRSAVIATLALVAVSPLSAKDHGRGRYERYDKHAYKHRGNAYRGGYYGRPAYYGRPYYGPVYVAPRQCARPVVVYDRPGYYDPYYYERPIVVAAPPTFGINVVIR
ncbi:MAG: hypothetical protein JST93_23625 [Acidobacteria bacterium]|nr:hypothetical protein [Acidobacteriota bacterium]